jgi:hypothetical protein
MVMPLVRWVLLARSQSRYTPCQGLPLHAASSGMAIHLAHGFVWLAPCRESCPGEPTPSCLLPAASSKAMAMACWSTWRGLRRHKCHAEACMGGLLGNKHGHPPWPRGLSGSVRVRHAALRGPTACNLLGQGKGHCGCLPRSGWREQRRPASSQPQAAPSLLSPRPCPCPQRQRISPTAVRHPKPIPHISPSLASVCSIRYMGHGSIPTRNMTKRCPRRLTQRPRRFMHIHRPLCNGFPYAIIGPFAEDTNERPGKNVEASHFKANHPAPRPV